MDHGFIGLGDMGGAMCRRLLASGVTVRVFDVADDAVASLVEDGAIAASSAAEVSGHCDTVSICVPADDHVRQVLSGPHGVEAGTHDGLSVLVHSTIHPDTMREVHDRGAAWGVRVHDACVAGGVAAAAEGELVVFVSEGDELGPDVRRILDALASRIIDTGPPGSGAAVKIGVNVMTYAMQAAAGAAIELVRGQGAPTDALIEAWRHNQQWPPIIERFSVLLDLPPASIESMREFIGTMVGIEQKDLALALALGDGTPRGPSPVLAALRDDLPVIFGLQPPA